MNSNRRQGEARGKGKGNGPDLWTEFQVSVRYSNRNVQ